MFGLPPLSVFSVSPASSLSDKLLSRNRRRELLFTLLFVLFLFKCDFVFSSCGCLCGCDSEGEAGEVGEAVMSEETELLQLLDVSQPSSCSLLTESPVSNPATEQVGEVKIDIKTCQIYRNEVADKMEK